MSDEILDQAAPIGDRRLPRDNNILALGIISIFICFGFLGIIMAIITITRANTALREYERYPKLYRDSSFKKVKAGKICSIVALCLFAVFILVVMNIGANQ